MATCIALEWRHGGWHGPRAAAFPESSSPMSEPIRRVVLAFSGGLDTSVILKWLRQTYDCEVVTFTADLGQGKKLERAAKRPGRWGAGPETTSTDNCAEESVRDTEFPWMRAT